MSEPTEGEPQGRIGPRFSVMRWTKDHLTRESGSMVDRLALIAVGVLSGSEDRYVLVNQIEELTGLSDGLVAGVLDDAEERGEVRRTGTKYWPVQKEIESSALDPAARARQALELSIVCETCSAFAGDECVTGQGRVSWSSHAPRRQHAIQVQRRTTAA